MLSDGYEFVKAKNKGSTLMVWFRHKETGHELVITRKFVVEEDEEEDNE